MGNLSRFDLGRIIRHYNTGYLFETGTLWGDGIAYALQSPFEKIFSVEIIPEIAAKARQRFLGNHKVAILERDSVTALQQQLPLLNGNIIFWLDAHFPGADAGLEKYDSDEDEQLRLPLIKEIAMISSLRKNHKDVLIIDDLRIYENGPYQNGNVPENALPKEERSIKFVLDNFSETHVVIKSYLDEGYLLLFPKTTYQKKHHVLVNLFSKTTIEKEHYLVSPVS